jgi:hypothetical protein
MKRIALVLMVLAVASLAQAGYYLTINGQDVTSVNIPVGGSVTVGVHSTDATPPAEPTAWGAYGIYHTLVVTCQKTGWAGALGTLSNPVATANTGASVTAPNIWEPQSAFAGWSVENPSDLTAGKWFEYTFTNTAGAGDIHLLTWGAGWATTTFHDTVSVIPEPATMALLGLGALALIRRK